jgi:predicted  nucleic acid-binding Zn-ribbon protein
MASDWSLNIVWWLTVVEVPALAGLLLLIWRVRGDLQTEIDTRTTRVNNDLDAVRDELSRHKVDVARSYVSLETLRDTESRLTSHLVRIEKKLDTVGFHPTSGDLS